MSLFLNLRQQTRTKQHAVYAWDGKDNKDYSLDPNFVPEEYNQLFVTVKNTAFSRHDDHDVYTD